MCADLYAVLANKWKIIPQYLGLKVDKHFGIVTGLSNMAGMPLQDSKYLWEHRVSKSNVILGDLSKGGKHGNTAVLELGGSVPTETQIRVH